LLFNPTELLVREAEELAAQGYGAVKLKIGQGIETDLRNVDGIRWALGESVKLMVDANCAYDTLEALELGRRLESSGVYWFEEPVAPENLEGYSKLAHALDMPIAGGESEFTHWAFKELLTREAIDIVQPDLGRCGGFTEARKIAALASAFDVPVAPHTGASSAVEIAAAIQWAAALPNLLTLEWMYPPNPLREELLVEPLPPMRDGQIEVPQKPGLGIEIDAQLVGMLEILATHRPGIEVQAAEVDRPDEVRHVNRAEFLRVLAARKFDHDGLEPPGALVGDPLLEKVRAGGTLGIAL
jgi:L-alanine-DL-glutamate epimerase-like enolase superfamily enzyme